MSADPNVLRGAVLVLLTFCCYGVQLLIGHERRIVEAREQFIVRTEHLRSTGRLAAEIAHQIKNPLTVINNVAFMLRNSAAGAKAEVWSLAGLNRTNELSALLQREPAQASARDPQDRTPLHYAVNSGSTAALQLLLRAKAEA